MREESLGERAERMRPREPQQGPQLSLDHNRRVFEQFMAERDAYHDAADARIRKRLGVRTVSGTT